MRGVRRHPAALVAGLVAVVAVVAAGCGSTAAYSRSDTYGLPSTRQDIEQHEWVLDRERSSLTVDDPNPVTLAVRGDAVSGAAPCNAYRGTFELDDDDTVAITDVALTKRACEPTTMDAEDELVAALDAVDHVDVEVDDGDAVRMALDGDGDDGEVRLAFRAFDADEEILGTWEVVGVAADDAVTSPAPGAQPTVTFEEGGTVTLDTGCRTADSSWELDGDALTIDPLDLGDGDCPDPALAAQEDDLVAALAAVDRIEIAPTELILVTADDTITLVATRSGDAP